MANKNPADVVEEKVAKEIEKAQKKIEKAAQRKRGPNWFIYIIGALAAFVTAEVISSVIRAQTEPDANKETTIALRPDHIGLALLAALILRPFLKNFLARSLVMGGLGFAADRYLGDKLATAIASLQK